jgi:Lrp/AsnC family transcriptional regulator, leucine-responsive regulatory protein
MQLPRFVSINPKLFTGFLHIIDKLCNITPMIDDLDKKILDMLQKFGRLSHVELSEKIGLSASQCSRRLTRLEENGTINHYAAILDAAKSGLDVTAFVSVMLEKHGEEEAAAFKRAIEARPNVLECWSVSGESDYMLRVVASSLQSFADWMMRDILSIPNVANVHSTIALDKIKQTTALPI